MDGQIIDALFDLGAVQIDVQNTVRHLEGIQSPVYCNTRLLYADATARKLVVDGFIAEIRQRSLRLDGVVAVASGAIGWGCLLAERLELPFAYAQPQPKRHGRTQHLQGSLTRGWRIVVMEDVLLTGGSASAVTFAIREEAAVRVEDIIGILNYDCPECRAAAAQLGVTIHSLLRIDDVLRAGRERGTFGSFEHEIAMRFALNPRAW